MTPGAPDLAPASPLYASFSLSREEITALKGEVERSAFVHVKDDKFGYKAAERRMTSPFDYASTRAPEGGVAERIAHSPKLLAAVRAFAGAPVEFSAGNYLFYQMGDFIGLHTDRPGCEVNALFLLSAGPTVFEYRDFRTGETARDLFTLAQEGDGVVDDAVRVPLPGAGSGVIFHSGRVPHQRRPAAEPVLLLSACYGG